MLLIVYTHLNTDEIRNVALLLVIYIKCINLLMESDVRKIYSCFYENIN